MIVINGTDSDVKKLFENEIIKKLAQSYTVLVCGEKITVESVDDLQNRLQETADKLIERLRRDVNRYVG